MSERDGWLLDLYEDPLGGVALWFLADDGERCRLHQFFPVTFYAAGPPARLRALYAWLERHPARETLRLRDDRRQDVFAGQMLDVLAVEVPGPSDLTALFSQVSRAFPDLTFADADLPLALRYSAAAGVGPLGRCRVSLDGDALVRSITPLDSPWDLDPAPLPLRVMELEPDRDPSHSAPRALLARFGGEQVRLDLRAERPLLVTLGAMLRQYDPDLLLTTCGDTWLLPLLLSLAEKHNLALPLNRDRDAGITRRGERWYYSYGQLVYRGEQVHLFGRWHVDRKNAMLWGDYELDGLLEMTRVTGLPLQTAARVSPGTGISAIQMQTALRLGILVPWQKQQVERPKSAFDLFCADQGGLVYQPQVGVHRDVAGIDFVSMYPAIMVYFNISPETINRTGPAAQRVPELNMVIDRSREGLVPQSLRPLLEKRVALKQRAPSLPRFDPRRASDKRRAMALKWLLVTCFGYLGYKNARFGRIEAHQAVTAYGREALLRAKEAAEDLGYDVLQMYVDGLWVQQPGKNHPDDITPLLEEVRARSGLPIALDGIYRWVVFLPSRTNPNRPVANRYFGLFQSGEIKMRGIAARRKDTPPFIARVQGELLAVLARHPQPEDGLPEARAWLRGRAAELRAGRVPLAELLVSQRITREVDEYRAPSPAARAARQLIDAGKVVKPGQRVKFLYVLGRVGVRAWGACEEIDPKTVDVARYRELLMRAAEEVLQPFEPNSCAQGTIAFCDTPITFCDRLRAVNHPLDWAAEDSL